MHTGTILIGVQKAFDTLDHQILLKKMTCLGFKISVIKWFESYISSRKFFVSASGIFSEAGISNCGVPQGSFLGPLLFLRHINDPLQLFSESGSYHYADDIRILNQDKHIHKIEDVLTKEFSTFCEWLVDNSCRFIWGR